MAARSRWMAFNFACICTFLAMTADADDAPKVTPGSQVTESSPADATTPKGALLLFIRALEAGDTEAAVGACLLREESAEADKEMLAAVASATKAHTELRKAIKARWADDAPGPEVQIKGFSRVFSEYDFTDPAITEDGDTTKAELRDKRGTIILARQQEAWKISLDGCMKDYSSYKPADVVKSFKECQEKATKLSERLAAGEFESFQAIQDDIDKADKEAAEKARNRKNAGL